MNHLNSVSKQQFIMTLSQVMYINYVTCLLYVSHKKNFSKISCL